MEGREKIVDQWDSEVGSFQLLLSEDETKCHLNIFPSRKVSDFSDIELMEELKSRGVIYGLNRREILACCKNLRVQIPSEHARVAEGICPIPGQPEHLELLVRPSSDIPKLLKEFRGNSTVDLHQLHLFENISEGQQVARVLSAEPGIAGITVLGREIPPPEPPPPIPFILGTGVELRENGDLFSTVDGRLIYDDHRVSVTDQLEIPQDVNFECGDIDFIGYVHIKGSVRSGFNVRGQKGLMIDHEVGHCKISSFGDIQLGGMTGGVEGGSIHCGGQLNCKYLHEVQVECRGSVHVRSEVMNCNILSAGSIRVDGVISGGNMVALAGIEVGRVGADACDRTYLCAGADYRNQDELQQFLTQLGVELFQDAELKCGVNPQVANPKVNILRKLFDGTVVHLGDTEQRIVDRFNGPYSIIEHRGDALIFLTWTPLEEHASILEARLVEQEDAKFNS